MARGLSARAHGKVLESATEFFAERGIDATSVDAIAATSGLSKEAGKRIAAQLGKAVWGILDPSWSAPGQTGVKSRMQESYR